MMNPSILIVIAATVLVIISQLASAQREIPQCECSAIAPCKGAYVGAVLPCLDQCQHHAAAIGADYQSLRQCFVAQIEPKLKATIACTENANRDSCSNGPTSRMVPKRYPETLKIAAMSEINRMLQRSGIADEARALIATGKLLYGCINGCMTRKAGNCEKKSNCGLALPPDSQLVQTGKSCALQSGMNTAGVQQICQCVAAAGVSQLSKLCSRIKIE